MVVSVYLDPIDHDPEGVILTTHGQRERLSLVEGHPSIALLSAPLLPLLGVSDHNVLTETWIVLQSDARVIAKIHMEPCGSGVNSPLDIDGHARSAIDGSPEWKGKHCRSKARESREKWKRRTRREGSLGGIGYMCRICRLSRKYHVSREHRVLEGNGGNFYFPTYSDGVHLLKCNTMSVVHEVTAIDIQLEGITADCDEQAEGRASEEHRVFLPLFSAPGAIVEGVGNHTIVSVIPGINMERNVRIGPGTTLQIHMEPVCSGQDSSTDGNRLPLLQTTMDCSSEGDSWVVKRRLLMKSHCPVG